MNNQKFIHLKKKKFRIILVSFFLREENKEEKKSWVLKCIGLHVVK